MKLSSPRLTLLLMLATALLSCTLLACGGQKDEPPPADIGAIVDRVLQAHGGVSNLERVWGYELTGTLRALQRGETIPMTRWFERPDRLLLILQYAQATEVRLTRGAVGWQGPDAQRLGRAHEPMLSSMRLQTARFDLPMRLREHLEELVRLDADERGRIVLRLALDETLDLDYHIDPRSFLLSETTMWMRGSFPMNFGAELDDYRDVEGVMFPFRERTTASGTMTSEITVQEIHINPEGLTDRLRPPSI